MRPTEIIEFTSALPHVRTQTAAEGDGSPPIAWGDTFFTYDPDGDAATAGRMPFATIVTKDYPGDTGSDLDRPDRFRVNLSVGRTRFTELLGHSPAAHAERDTGTDHAEPDRILPHPLYAVQGWVCVVNPGDRTTAVLSGLLEHAHSAAARRHRPRD